jgi:hypothetical protein
MVHNKWPTAVQKQYHRHQQEMSPTASGITANGTTENVRLRVSTHQRFIDDWIAWSAPSPPLEWLRV